MSLLFLLSVFLLVCALVLVFVWSAHPRRKDAGSFSERLSLGEHRESHVVHCAQIRQALSRADFEYLAAAGDPKLAKRVRRERRRIAIAYAAELKGDFYQLVRLGKVIAKLSPEVVTLKEFERVVLTAQFLWRVRWIQIRLFFGAAALPQVVEISELVGQLGVRVETALKELGERAAIAIQMASSVDRGRLDTV